MAMKLKTIVITTLALGALAGGIWLSNQSPQYSPSPIAQVPAFQVPQVLQQAGSQIGLSLSQLQAVKAQIGTADCNAGAEACYIPATDTVYVYPNTLDVPNALAYEYYHHIWYYNLTDDQHTALAPSLDTLDTQLSANPDAATELSFINGEDPSAHYSELYSIGCVETHTLNPDLYASCYSHGLNLSSLTTVYP